MAVRKCMAAAVTALSLAACASTPDVTATYYFPKAQTQISVIQTIACNSDNTALQAVATVTPTTVYSADRGDGYEVGHFSYRALDGTFADSDAAFSFTDDGRLAGINASSTGQGATILKNVIAFGKLVVPASPLRAEPDVTRACKVVKLFSGDKAATLTYSRTITYSGAEFGTALPILPDPGSAIVFNRLQQIFPNIGFTVAVSRGAPVATASWSGMDSDVVEIKLNKVAVASFDVRGPSADFSASGQSLWTGSAPIPLREYYSLPIPRAALFGKQTFALQLSNYGSVQKLQYGKANGIAEATDAATALVKAVQPSASDQAAAIKAEADLIAQQQRLALCKADPTSCK